MIKVDCNKAKTEFYFNSDAQVYLNFIKYTSQSDNAVQYIKNIIKTHFLTKISSPCLQYLDIGCGFGNKTKSIVSLIKQYHSINAVAIDPSVEFICIFDQNKEHKEIELIRSTWEEYSTVNKFHLITSIHTFYYIDDWELSIKKMLNALHDNGVICVSIRSKDELHRFKEYFYRKIYNKQFSERSFEELIFILDNLDLKYKLDIIESKLNIENCLIETDSGIKLLEFLLQIPYNDIPDSFRKEIIEYINQKQNNGYLSHRDGFVWIYK
jgi:SAM-dependent methyltransferase